MTRDRLPTEEDERNYDEQRAERNELAALVKEVHRGRLEMCKCSVAVLSSSSQLRLSISAALSRRVGSNVMHVSRTCSTGPEKLARRLPLSASGTSIDVRRLALAATRATCIW